MKKISDMNLYEILNVNEDATFDEIKAAYKKLVRIYHPDISNSKESNDIFKKICNAYDILSDENKRKLYDLNHGYNQQPKHNTEDSVNTLENGNEDNSAEKNADYKMNEEDKISKSTLSEILNGIFVYVKNAAKSNKNKQKTDDVYANVTISAKEAMIGTNRIINIVKTISCPNCAGKKFVNEALCPLCKGSGEVSNHKRINAKIPPNTHNGAKIKIEGINTDFSSNNGGDLYIIVTIDEKSLFTVKDNTVYMDLPITTYEAALGANIQIPTFYDDITIKIPPNTSSGQKFRLKGQGIIDKQKNTKGDMIVTVVIKLPNVLSAKEIELYKELRECSTGNIRESLRENE